MKPSSRGARNRLGSGEADPENAQAGERSSESSEAGEKGSEGPFHWFRRAVGEGYSVRSGVSTSLSGDTSASGSALVITGGFGTFIV